MKILTGLIDYNEGEVRIAGREIRKEKGELRKIIGYLPENPVFYEYMTGEEYLYFLGRLVAVKKKNAERVEELLEAVKLAKAKNGALADIPGE